MDSAICSACREKDGLLTMYRYTTKGETIKRTLGSGDQLGVVDLYD
ncbi:MAG: hypothetical protein IIC00_05120 [Planctomycetes bacterium]|nr:hypothetical protein [Planctomycetota bacterium]